MQEHPEKEVNEVEEVVTNTKLVEPTEEKTVPEQPEPNISIKKDRKKKNI